MIQNSNLNLKNKSLKEAQDLEDRENWNDNVGSSKNLLRLYEMRTKSLK